MSQPSPLSRSHPVSHIPDRLGHSLGIQPCRANTRSTLAEDMQCGPLITLHNGRTMPIGWKDNIYCTSFFPCTIRYKGLYVIYCSISIHTSIMFFNTESTCNDSFLGGVLQSPYNKTHTGAHFVSYFIMKLVIFFILAGRKSYIFVFSLVSKKVPNL